MTKNYSQLQDGKADFIVTTDDIKTTPGLPWFPDGRRLQIEAEVIEKTSGKKESAIDNGIYFVKSPFRIDHKATTEFFKPALPFLVKVGKRSYNSLKYYKNLDFMMYQTLNLISLNAVTPSWTKAHVLWANKVCFKDYLNMKLWFSLFVRLIKGTRQSTATVVWTNKTSVFIIPCNTVTSDRISRWTSLTVLCFVE